MSNSMGSEGINSTSKAIEIVRGEAECYLLLYECYESRILSLPVLSHVNSTPASLFVLFSK